MNAATAVHKHPAARHNGRNIGKYNSSTSKNIMAPSQIHPVSIYLYVVKLHILFEYCNIHIMNIYNIASEVDKIRKELKSFGSRKNLEGMARFGIETSSALGTGMVPVREIARRYKKQHALALALWSTGIHELRILAALIDDPAQVSPEQADEWIQDFNSWDLCDQACMNLFDKTSWAQEKAIEWCSRTAEFEKRAGFAMIASMAVHRKNEPDTFFMPFFPAIREGATDSRNFVWKAVHWALRQLGKRKNGNLRIPAWDLALELSHSEDKTARKVGKAALREFEAKFGSSSNF